jgi:hypothetical protein
MELLVRGQVVGLKLMGVPLKASFALSGDFGNQDLAISSVLL